MSEQPDDQEPSWPDPADEPDDEPSEPWAKDDQKE
jgi:hypothetical protein